jgi:hypothetical protein
VVGTVEARNYLAAYYKEFSSASLLPATSAEAIPAMSMNSSELERFQNLSDFYREAKRASAELNQQLRTWRLYEQAVSAVAAVDTGISTVITKIARLPSR